MKTQMRFQKILMLVTLVISALCFVYSLAFLTGGLGNATYYKPLEGDTYVDKINATKFIDVSQAFVSTSVVLSIVFIILSVLLFFTSCHTRRNYYITNYIVIGAVVLFAFAITIYAFVGISNVMDLYLNDIAWEAGTNGGLNYAEQLDANYPLKRTSANFAIGYVLYALVLVVIVALVLNLIWKIKLMKGEKALLENGIEKEVA